MENKERSLQSYLTPSLVIHWAHILWTRGKFENVEPKSLMVIQDNCKYNGIEDEDPWTHILKYDDLYNILAGQDSEAFKLHLFKFTSCEKVDD